MIQKRLKQNINTSAIIDNTGNTQDITQLKIDVANNTQQITNNSQEIGTLQTQVAQNTQDITGFNQITTDLETKYNGLEPKVTQNQSDINALQTTVQDLEPRVTANEASITTINSTLTNVAKKNEQNTFTMQQNFNADIVLTNSSIKSTTGDLNINEGGSRVQVKTDLLMNDHWIANLHDPNSAQDAATKNYVDNADTAISNRVTNIETSLANGNIVNYVGNYDSATTYAVGQCVTFNDKWYVSKINGNVGHQPDTSPTQWELLSAPAVDLTPYLTKTEASTTYETIANVNALTTRVGTNEQSIATINTTLNGVAKLATDNTFTANNTFNNPITINNAIGIKRSATDISIVELNAQNSKNINLDFNQQSGDYKNYCNFKIRHKHKTNNYVDILKFEFRPDNNEGIFVTTPLGFIDFGNKNLKCSRTPTDNSNLTNKQYVDNAINGCAKLASSNTFTQQNTFNGITNFRSRVELKNTTNNNGGFLENFEYNSKNYTALKLFKNNNRNLLQIEANNNDEIVNINSGTGANIININHLAAPTQPNHAATKAYVDSRTTTYKWEGVVNNGNTQNLLNIGWDKHIIGVVLFRKRSDNQWFCMNSNMSQQIYRLDSGQFCLYGANASGSPTFNNDYKIFITYIN